MGKNKEITKQELQEQAQKLLNTKIQKASKEINVVLQKYGLILKVEQTINIVPRRQ